ncbi:spore coat U domain-containing protein [Phyllobacterium zundukense]|uniref:Csu type fimbrial protein n=1 Tax=Phyllobacterium zundukense TaxID=1867719 RepID=UPI000C1C14E4|nr:spore coat protein U domain-containing protein [Phyllobacterium zundukense]
MKRYLIGACLFICLNLLPAAALAQSCTFSTSNMVFSGSPLTGAAINGTTSLTANCSAVLGLFRRVLICPNLNAGSGGATASARTMTGPASLNYQLYQDSARQVVWGSWTWAFAPRPPEFFVDIPALVGNGSTTVTMYGQVLANQTTAPIGSYSSTFSGVQTTFRYRFNDDAGCANPAGIQGTTNFTVSLQTAKDCLVSAQNIDFGNRGVLSSNIDQDGQVTVTCSPTTPYVVALSPGGANAGPTARRMTKGAEFITYGLYRNTARSLPWGDTTGTNTVGGTGTGLAQNLPVYARIPPQTTPTPGTYSDTIIVTVTY